nr:SurA N-terminal domain-containing protein [uncultured Desulfuromonas sp.]
MLDLIRKKQKTTLVKVVFWVIIATFIGTIFLVWGKGRDQQRDITVAAQVNGTDISFEQFRTTYSNMYNLYHNLYGQNFTPELEKQLQLTRQSINLLIDQALLLEEAERMHLSISDDELVQTIAEVPAFQVDGVFNKEQYISVLSYQRMTPELFEQMQKQQMLVNLTQAQIRSEAVVSDEDVADEYRRLNEKVNLSYVAFKTGDFTDAVKVTDEGLSSYYAANQESFRVAQQVALSLVTLSPADYLEQVTLEEGDIQRYYDRHLANYAIPEQVSAAHILIPVAADADDAQREKQRALAEQVLEKAQTGDFAKLAKQYSADAATAKKGGELGLFQRGVMDPAFESAAFALTKDTLSPVVETRFGYHIIKGGEHIEAGFTPLAEVRDEVEKALRLDEARKLAYEKAMDAYNLNRKENNFSAAAETLGATPVETGLFSQAQAIPAVGISAELTEKAFAANAGELLAPVNTTRGVVLATVTENVASHIPELSAVKAEVTEAYKRQQAVVLAEEAAQQALDKIQQGAKLTSIADKGRPVEETGLFSRALGEFVPTLGNVPGLAEAAFNLSIKEPVASQLYSAGETFYVVRLKQLQPADPNGLTEEESQRLQQTVLARKQDELLRGKLEQLKQTAEVIIAPAILRSMEEGNES